MRSFLSFSLVTAVGTIFLIGATVSSYHFLFSYDASDEQEYWTLMEESDPTLSNAAATPYTAKQERQQLHKHMWTNSAAGNLELCIRSENAEFVLDRRDDSTDIIEHMHNVQCYMQEELFYLLPDGSEVMRQSDGGLVLRDSESSVRITEDGINLTPMQIIRYMEADAASYYYKTDQLVAEQVTISCFAVPGHELVESLDNITPLMSGIASHRIYS